MKNSIKFILSVYFILIDCVTYAQPNDDDSGGGLEGDDPPFAEIDARLYILLLLGILYTFYKLRYSEKQLSNSVPNVRFSNQY